MPRRGTGSKAAPYGNRQDLNLPASAEPGQEYGEAGAQRDAQSAVPMASAPTQGAAPQAAPPANLPQPGSLPFLHPTQRPTEPVTHGLPVGEGAGPEVLPPTDVNPRAAVLADLERLAAGPYATPQIQQLAQFARGA